MVKFVRVRSSVSRFPSLAVPLMVAIGALAAPASAAPGDDPGKQPDVSGGAAPDVAANVALVAGLKGTDECLWRMGVFPQEGVGYEETLMMLEPQAAAFQEYRDAMLRANPTVLMDVLFVKGAEGVQAVAVGVGGKAPASVESFAAHSAEVSETANALQAHGVSLTMTAGDVPSMVQVCEIQSKLLAMKDPVGGSIPLYVAPDAAKGAVTVHISAKHSAQALATVGEAAKWLAVKEVEGIRDAGRYDDTPPWYGGTQITGAGSSCTSSFRVTGGGGTWQGMLTADHCPGPYYSNGRFFGNRASSLASAQVDAVLATGSSYGSRVWTGGLYTTTSIPANGVYPYYTLTYDDWLFVSGAKSGQSSLRYGGLPSSNGCIMSESGYWCQILSTIADGGRCISGDSGGPVGVYDQANGRIISVGIVKGTVGDTRYAHECYITNTMAITYLYGGTPIG